MAEELVALKQKPCKWRQILSKHTTNRPLEEENPLQSIASCADKGRVAKSKGEPWYWFAIEAGAAFFPDDGVNWRMMARANTAHEAEEGCCLQGVAFLLLLDAPNFKLLEKDWVGGAQVVAQKAHDMMHEWLLHESDKGHADGGRFCQAMFSGDVSGEVRAVEKFQTITLQHSTTPQNEGTVWRGPGRTRGPRTVPRPRPEPDTERDDQIRVLVCGFLDRWARSGREGPVNMGQAVGGKKYGPELGALLPPRTLRAWLESEDQFEVVDQGNGAWGVKYRSPDNKAGSGGSSSDGVLQFSGPTQI